MNFRLPMPLRFSWSGSAIAPGIEIAPDVTPKIFSGLATPHDLHEGGLPPPV